MRERVVTKAVEKWMFKYHFSKIPRPYGYFELVNLDGLILIDNLI
jgi:hypothetical protein